MPGDPSEFEMLVERYRTLGAADRKAVRRKLSTADFEALENVSVEIQRVRRAERAPERQFRGYSPSLADLIERALGDDPAKPEVTAECRAAIVSSHLSIAGEQGEEALFGRLGRLLGIAGPGKGAAGSR